MTKAVKCFCDKCGWVGEAEPPYYNHEDCPYCAMPVTEWHAWAEKFEAQVKRILEGAEK